MKLLEAVVSDILAEAAPKPSPEHVFYHGTNKEFHEFKDHAERTSKTPDNEVKGHFFTHDPHQAYGYASHAVRAHGGKHRVVKAHLHLDNPKDVTSKIKAHIKGGMKFNDAKRKAYAEVDQKKHDGVYHRGVGAANAEYVAFHAHKVKIIP